MTTILGRWPAWALAAALAAAGCGQPPPMVSMSPPGSGIDPLALDLSDDSMRAQAVGESPGGGRTKSSGASGEAELQSVILEPTEPGEEIETDTGLVYSTIEPGDPEGETAEVGDRVSAFYTGTLPDGTVFDSNVGKSPLTFPLGPQSGLIRGWNLGIPGMKVGERRKLILPPELAYGERGSPPTIPPGATLTFEIELSEISKGG